MKIIVILVLAYVLLIQSIGSIALWDPDEPRQAIMAREMMERHDYIHTYLNGKPYLEKPPFFSWMIVLAAKIRGNLDEFSSRIPSAVAATLLVLITFSLGCMLLDREAGLLSAVVLLTNYQFLSNAREAVMDMTFAFFIGLTIFLAYLSVNKGRKWVFALSFVSSSLAILTKGPAGLVIPAGTIFVYLIAKKDLKRFFIPLAAGCILSSLVASIWFLLAGEAYWREFILRQNVTRYTHAFDHIENVFYYFQKLFFNFLPWSILLPFSLYHAVRKRYWLPLIWFSFTFLFFEFSMSKRAIYLISLYPAAALLCGLYLKDRWPWLITRPVTGLLVRCFALLLTLLPVAGTVALRLFPNPMVAAFREGPATLYVYITVLFAAGGVVFYYALRKSQKGSIVALCFYFVVMGFFYGAYYMPVMDKAFKSPRRITDELKGISKQTEIYTYGFSSAGIIFYVGRPIHTFNDISEIKDDKHDILLIVEDGPATHMKGELDARFRSFAKARYEKEYYTLYVRRDGR
jgi:4-amino-4-deoxy-L-arabinose transferase-like glycosyltransferase